MDFTLKQYKELLKSLQSAGFFFQTFHEYLNTTAQCHSEPGLPGEEPLIILRHDVDLLPANSLHFARIQHELGIRGTYYFRAVPESWDEDIIREIASLGHEVGYHYENLTTCNGNLEAAYEDFKLNLEKLRRLAPVTTICMHGSPRSPYDSKDLWLQPPPLSFRTGVAGKKPPQPYYNYRSLGILGEPYFDLDFNQFFYLTDTGRRWDGWKVSVRDKMPQQEQWVKQGLIFHSTNDIIKALSNRSMSGAEMRSMSEVEMPNQIMITFHPQRWTDNPLPWLKELIWQTAKNQVKRWMVKGKG